MIDVVLIVGCLVPITICALTDVKSYIIPDKVTLPMLLVGLIYAVCTGRAQDALLGMLLGFGIIFICVRLDGAGGGDLKLATALGAWFGCQQIIHILLIGSLIGLFWGCYLLYKQGELKTRVQIFFKGVWNDCVLGMKGTMQLPKLPENPDAPVPIDAVPFGTCLAAAVWIICFIKVV